MPFTLDDLRRVLALRPSPSPSSAALRHDDDVRILALTLDGEGRNQSLEGRAAIAWTVRNRRERYGPDIGRSYADVCLRRLQYSCWWTLGGADNANRLLDLAAREFEFEPTRTRTDLRFGVGRGSAGRTETGAPFGPRSPGRGPRGRRATRPSSPRPPPALPRRRLRSAPSASSGPSAARSRARRVAARSSSARPPRPRARRRRDRRAREGPTLARARHARRSRSRRGSA